MLYRVIAYLVFFQIVAIPFYIIELDKRTYRIKWSEFFEILLTLSVWGLVSWLFLRSRKKKVVIEGESVKVGNYLFPKTKELAMNDIKGMTWMNRNKTYGSTKGFSTTVNISEFSVYFKDGSELNLSKSDYDNYEEIANCFYGYCRKHEIIKIDPLEVRKRSRYRRPEKVMKL